MQLPRVALTLYLLPSLLVACQPEPQPEPITQEPNNPPPVSWELSLGDDTRHGDPVGTLTPQAAGCPTRLAAPYNAAELDVGLYWYSPGSALAPGGMGCRARSDGGAIPGYYDPSKPVLIYVHGWQPDTVQKGILPLTTLNTRRDNFWYDSGKLNVADNWLKAGWNIALFQWTQLADDQGHFFMPYSVQAKIWTWNYVAFNTPGQEVPIKMRYVTTFGLSDQNMPTVSAGELFYQAYKSALQQWRYQGSEPVRLIGHSLGAQMVLSLGEQALNDYANGGTLPYRQIPRRLILADPYWTAATPVPGENYAYLAPDANPAARSTRIAQRLIQNGVVIEWIKSSLLLDYGGDNNLALMNLASRTTLTPDFLNWTDLSGRHNSATRWYLWTKTATNDATSAANDLNTARALMNQRTNHLQSGGMATPSPTDDFFTVLW